MFVFLVNDFNKSSNKSSKIINIFKGNIFKLLLNWDWININMSQFLDSNKKLSKVFKKLQINSNGKQIS
jgi:hypothetical protein